MTSPDTPIQPGQDTDSAVQQQTPAPFPDADVFDLTRDVNQVQLSDELTSALGASVIVSISPMNGLLPISDANPAKLYLSPSGQDQAKVYNTINAHVPYQAYSVPAADRQYSAAVQKVVSDINTDLTPDEMQTLIKGLAIKQNTAAATEIGTDIPGTTSTS